VLLVLGRLFRSHHHRHAFLLLGGVVVCMAAGGAAFALTQNMPLTTGWYWAITTATTVGYGDVIPHNPVGRLIASLVMLTTIPMLAAAFALLTGSAVSSRVRRLLEMHSHLPQGPYRLVIGSHPTVPAILRELVQAGDTVVLVADTDPAGLPSEVHLVRGDPTKADVLRSVDPSRAVHALLAAESDADVLLSAVLLREEAPEVPTTALVRSMSVGTALRELGVNQVVSADELVAHALAKSLEAPHAGELLLGLLDSERNRLVEQVIEPDTPSRPLSALRAERAELILGVVSGGSLSLGVGDDPDVAAGDVLLLVKAGLPRRRH